MSIRVTDFRIDKVEMTESDWFALPAEAIELIRTYAEFKKAPPGMVHFEVPIYRWEEINALLQRLPQGHSTGTGASNEK